MTIKKIVNFVGDLGPNLDKSNWNSQLLINYPGGSYGSALINRATLLAGTTVGSTFGAHCVGAFAQMFSYPAGEIIVFSADVTGTILEGAGRYFSFTPQISGSYVEKARSDIFENIFQTVLVPTLLQTPELASVARAAATMLIPKLAGKYGS